MNEEKAIRELKKWQGEGDTEIQHSFADKILMDFLNSLGYKKIVEEYKKIPKWYS